MLKIIVFVFASVLIIGCKPSIQPPTLRANLATLDRVVYLGDSYLSGYQDAALSEDGQVHSVAALLSRSFENVGGGAIVGQQDVRSAIKDFRNAVLKSRRRMLLDKANQLGGSDLVNKWIGLHVIGAKQEEIKKIQIDPSGRLADIYLENNIWIDNKKMQDSTQIVFKNKL